MDSLRRPLLVVLLVALTQYALSLALVDRARRSETLPTEMQAIDQLAMSVRRAVANVLWVRVDDYLHASEAVTVGEKGHEHALGVSARLSAHELFPMARLVTMLDPTFVRAGAVLGGLFLRHPTKRDEATGLLLSLIKANAEHPRVFLLHATLGGERWKAGDLRGARPFLERAVALYPRVLDEALCKRFGEPPADQTDDFVRRGAVAALVSLLTEQGEYDEAVRYLHGSEGFAPSGKVVQTLARYHAQRQAGKVDRAGLARYYAALKEQERFENARMQPRDADLSAGVRLAAELNRSHEPPLPRLVAQEVEWLAIGLPARQGLKMALVVIAIALVTICRGRRAVSN